MSFGKVSFGKGVFRQNVRPPVCELVLNRSSVRIALSLLEYVCPFPGMCLLYDQEAKVLAPSQVDAQVPRHLSSYLQQLHSIWIAIVTSASTHSSTFAKLEISGLELFSNVYLG
jgi:hypothetical protein